MNYSIELLRLLSVTLLVLTHTRHGLSSGYLYFFVEVLPTYATSLLSLVSGFLFLEYSSKKGDILNKKIKTLLVPYLFSNLIVISVVYILYLIGYEYLNRLSFDYRMITDGLLSLSSEPINPPTYFIRDIFIFFCLVSLIRRNYYSLIFLVPYIAFGNLFLRLDVIFLVVCGMSISYMKILISNQKRSVLFILFFSLIYLLLSEYDYPFKFILSLFVFISIYDVKVKFFNVGGFSYMLHLYHAPIIIFLHPLISRRISGDLISISVQFILTLCVTFALYQIVKRLKLNFLIGDRR